MIAERTALTPVSAWNQLMMTSEKASIAPHDRSNAPAVSGTSTAQAEDADHDLVAEHDLERGLGEERVGDPQAEEHEDQRQQVQHARLAEAG